MYDYKSYLLKINECLFAQKFIQQFFAVLFLFDIDSDNCSVYSPLLCFINLDTKCYIITTIFYRFE